MIIRKNIGYYIFIFLTIMLSDDTLLFGTNGNTLFSNSKIIFYVGVIIYSFTKKSIKFSIFLPFLLVCTMLLSNIATLNFYLGNYLYILVFIYSIAILKLIGAKKYFYYFSEVIIYLSQFSLIIYFINIFLPSLIDFFPVIYNYAEVPFNFLFFSNTFKGTNEFRNTGIFREPGVFGIYLIISLIDVLFININRKGLKKKFIILIFTLLTTLSTGSIIMLPVILIIYFIKEGKFANLYRILFGSGIFTTLYLVFPDIGNIIFGKLNSDNYEYLSTLARLSSLIVPYNIFIENFLFGVGLENFSRFYSEYSLRLFNIEFLSESAATNTIFNFLAVYGIFFSSVIMLLLFKTSTYLYKRGAFFFLIFFIILFSSQEMKFSTLFNIILCFGLFNYKKV